MLDGPRGAGVRPGPGARSAQQLRPRRAAGPHQRHQQSLFDQYTAQFRAAEAAVQSAEQALRNARINVSYTELRSPIDGTISNTSAHVGDYVGPGTQFTVLTTVSNTDTMTVDVAIPMSQYLRLAGGRTTLYDNEGLLSDIRLTLADGTPVSRRRVLQLHAQGHSERHGHAGPRRGVSQSRRNAQAGAVRPRRGQCRPRAAARRRSAP